MEPACKGHGYEIFLALRSIFASCQSVFEANFLWTKCRPYLDDPKNMHNLIRRERISLDRDHGRERCSDFHSVASTTTTSKSVRFSMEQQLEEEEEAAAAAEIYMDYRYDESEKLPSEKVLEEVEFTFWILPSGRA